MRKIKYVMGILLLIAAIVLCQKAGTYMLDSIETKANLKTNTENLEDGGVEKKVIVVDSGHGGKDPGKVGISGTLEKDLNLKIAQKVQELLEKEKLTVIMTREDDNGLADSKGEDMKKRVEIIDEKQPSLAISIHQNSYQTSDVKGAQVFYYNGSTEGENAANILQKQLLTIDESNTRAAKANGNYYLLCNTKVPLVIVECGFLSNAQEEEKLNTEEYQDKVAAAIRDGVKEYLGME